MLKELRKRIREARKSISPQYARLASFKMSERIAATEAYRRAAAIAAYIAFDGEADPRPLMERALQEGKSVAIPRITAKGQPLSFARWDVSTPLEANRFGIGESTVQGTPGLSATEFDLVICPLVAFDLKCNRIGMGGGYYDRTFAWIKDGELGENESPVLIGLAYQMQEVKAISPAEHDVPMSQIVTEAAVYQRG